MNEATSIRRVVSLHIEGLILVTASKKKKCVSYNINTRIRTKSRVGDLG